MNVFAEIILVCGAVYTTAIKDAERKKPFFLFIIYYYFIIIIIIILSLCSQKLLGQSVEETCWQKMNFLLPTQKSIRIASLQPPTLVCR
jgi:hypothetical protein